jgi:hypothetical protein
MDQEKLENEIEIRLRYAFPNDVPEESIQIAVRSMMDMFNRLKMGDNPLEGFY